MSVHGTAANYHVLSIIESCARLGVNRTILIESSGISAKSLEQPYARQSGESVLKLWQCAEQLSGNPMLPFLVGSMSSQMQRSAVTSLLESSANLGAALKIGIRYQHITQTIIKSYMYYDKHLGYMIIDSQGSNREQVRAQIERQIAFVFSIAKNLATEEQGMFGDVEAHFKGAPKTNISDYEDILGIKVRFHCDSDQLVFPKKTLELRNFSACAEVQASMLLVVQKHEQDLLFGLGMRSKVRQIIADSLGHTAIEIEGVATSLNVSTRTLQRRLREENTNFSEVYDEVRKQRAMEILSREILTMSELSYHLGFNHITSFYTAFNRWTSETLAEYRSKQAAE